MPEFTIDSLQKNCAHVDPDLRVMILRDFCDEIRKGKYTTFNAADEKVVVSVISERFSPYERVKDVQSEAIRTLDLVTPILSPSALQSLTTSFVESTATVAGTFVKEQRVTAESIPLLRENGCLAIRMVLKRMATTVEGEAATHFVRSILTPFLATIPKQTEDPAKRDFYEVLQPLLASMGQYLTPNDCSNLYKQIRADWECKTTHLFNQLSAVNATLFPLLPEDQFKVALANLVKDLNTKRGEAFRRNLSAFIGVIRTSSARVGDNVPELFRILNTELQRLESAADDDEGENSEARASILDSLKVLVRDCPKEAEPYLDNVTTVALTLVAYDPNYCGDDEAETDNATANDGGDDEDNEYADYYGGDDAYEYDDDQANAEDLSWKVRLAATALLSALLRNTQSRKGAEEALKRLVSGSTPLLVKRLKDRVETVRLEGFDLLTAALELVSTEHSVPYNASQGLAPTNLGLAYGRDTNLQLDALPTAIIFDASQVAIVGLLSAALDDKSTKISTKAADTLRKFLLVRDGAALTLADTLVAEFKKLMVDEAARRKSAAILPTIFQLLRFLIFRSTRADIKDKNAASKFFSLTPLVAASCSDKTPSTAKAAIELAADIAVAGATNQSATDVASLYNAVSEILTSTDADAKLAAVTAIAKIVSTNEERLLSAGVNLDSSYLALADLLTLDSSRRVAASAIKVLARGKISAARVAQFADSLVKILHRADRQEREAAIGATAVLVASHPAEVPAKAYTAIVDALAAPLVASSTFVERELTISALSFQLAAAVAASKNAAAVGGVADQVVPRMLEFLTKPSVQGLPVIEAGKAFYALGASGEAACAKTIERAQAIFATESAGNVSVAFGALIAADGNTSRRNTAFEKLAAKIGDVNEGPKAATAIGEAGRYTSLAAAPAALDALLSPSFKSEDIAAAVTNALSKATSTSAGTATFNKLLSVGITGNNYIASRALRSSVADGALAPAQHPLSSSDVFSSTLSTLVTAIGSSHDVVEVQEALGQLAAWNLTATLEKISGLIGSGKEELIAAAGYALRYTLRSARSSTNDRDAVLAVSNKLFAHFSRPGKLAIRRNCLLLLKAFLSEGLYTEAVHAQTFAAVVTELSVDTSLVKVTDLGVVKHRDDRGIDLRRNTFDFVRDLLASPESAYLSSADLKAVAKATVAALGPTAGLDSEEDEDIISAARKQVFVLRYLPPAWATATEDLNLVAKYMASSLKAKAAKDGVADKKEEEGIALAVAVLLFLKKETSADKQAGDFSERVKAAEADPHAPRARIVLSDLVANARK